MQEIDEKAFGSHVTVALIEIHCKIIKNGVRCERLSCLLVFLYCCCWHYVGFSDMRDFTYIFLHETHRTVMFVGLEPYAGIPCSKHVVGVAYVYVPHRLLWKFLYLLNRLVCVVRI